MIDLTHVYKIYSGHVQALSNIELKVGKGEFIYVTGPSGAGKTTLFRMITGYDKPTTGDVSVAGQDMVTVTPAQIPFVRRKIGVVFQDFKLLHNRTVFENVAIPLQVVGARIPEITARVNDILDQVGLRYKGQAFPDQLSGGEQQRVAIARALVNKPGLVIADEPTGNLDQDLSEGIMDLFAKINAQGTTVVIATHNMSLVNRGARRVIRLEKGKIVRDA